MTAKPITINTEFDDEKISGLLCCAFEGGSNYWYVIEKYIYPKGTSAKDFGDGGKMQGKNYFHPCQLVPVKGGALLIRSLLDEELNGKKSWRLDRAAIMRGLKVMAEKYPRHYGDFINEQDDADTGDVFLQCCLFGELIYG